MPSIAYNIMLAGPRARREPHGQTQKLVPHSVSMLADLYEVAHGVDTAARFDLHSARESNLVQYGAVGLGQDGIQSI